MGSPSWGGWTGEGTPAHPRVPVPQLRRGLRDLGLSPIPCSASPPPPLRPRRLLPSAAQTPIEEFTPTPAFPALQYLESVDEGGVAWRAGLRMGDFLIEVSLSPQPQPCCCRHPSLRRDPGDESPGPA